MTERKLVGKVIHYFGDISVAGVEVLDSIAVGDLVLFIGHTTALEQPVGSMELDHQPIEVAKKGQEVGIRVVDRVRPGDEIYRLSE